MFRMLLRSIATDAMDSNLDNEIPAFTEEDLDGSKIFEFINKCRIKKEEKINERNKMMKKDMKKI